MFVLVEVLGVCTSVGFDIAPDHRDAPGADDVVGCEWSSRGDALEVDALDEAGRDRIAVATQDHRTVCRF